MVYIVTQLLDYLLAVGFDSRSPSKSAKKNPPFTPGASIDLQFSRKLLVSPTSFIGTTARPSSVKTSLVMAASKPKRSVKQSLHPDFAYEFPGLISPTEIDA